MDTKKERDCDRTRNNSKTTHIRTGKCTRNREIFKWDGIWRAGGGNFIELGYLDDEKTAETVEILFPK